MAKGSGTTGYGCPKPLSRFSPPGPLIGRLRSVLRPLTLVSAGINGYNLIQISIAGETSHEKAARRMGCGRLDDETDAGWRRRLARE